MNASIQPVAKKDFYPLSSAQRRMYVVSQMDKASTNYNIYMYLPIPSETSASQLEHAFRELIKRHEILRTCFETVDDFPVQRIIDDVDFSVEIMEEAHVDIHAALDRFVRPFNLESAPMMRAGMVMLMGGSTYLLLDIHHIIFDGSSSDIFLAELRSLFNGDQLPPLTIHYKDYAVWQQERLASGQFRRQEEYWLQKMAGPIPILNLSTDYPRPAILEFEGNEISISIHADVHKRLRKLSVDNRCSFFAVMLTAYYILLNKYTGQEDIIVGTPVAGRLHPDVENIIGMFVNTLPFRNRPSAEKTTLALLEEVKNSILEAYDNQDCPFELIVDRLHVGRQTSRNPLFDTIFTVSEGKLDPLVKAGGVNPRRTTSKFDLSFTVMDSPDELTVVVAYRTSIFKSDSIKRMASHYQAVLENISLAPTQPIRDLQIISKEERDQILHVFNDTKVASSRHTTLNEWFEQQTDISPDAIALQLGSRTMTYRELDQVTNAMAGRLRELGVKPNVQVALMASRSFDMIIGLMAILKAGGAYVPIDPTYPKARIDFLLQDSRCDIMITQYHLKDLISSDSLKTICIGDVDPTRNERLPSVNTASDLAYVIYTSGSTGTPKGVMIEHRSVINFIEHQKMKHRISGEHRILQFSSLCFDPSVEQIFLALLTGARLVLVDRDTLTDIRQFEAYLAQTGITYLHAIPSFLQQLSSVLSPTLKYVVSAGEECPAALATKWHPFVSFYNKYGPTETTITCIETDGAVTDEWSIGRPISNMRAYVLNGVGDLCPIGLVGELCISGEGVARGYFGKDDLTKEKFQKDPFFPDCVMYRTGDLAKWLPDGRIVFLGRCDHQVKIRGFRIEPDEVRKRLMELNVIIDAVVTVQEHQETKHLCAYFVSDAEVKIFDLREHLMETLPDYMVPTFFFPIEQMPLNANGKIDRHALPPIGNFLTNDELHEPPTGPIEKTLALLWSDVIGVDNPSMKDNFFERGGNSLSAVVFANRIQRHFGIDITLRDVFSHQVLGELANFVSGMQPAINIIENHDNIEVWI